MHKIYFTINFIIGLLGSLFIYGLWSKFAANPPTGMSFVYLVLFLIPAGAFTICSILGLFDKASVKSVEICRVLVFVGLVVGALLSRFTT